MKASMFERLAVGGFLLFTARQRCAQCWREGGGVTSADIPWFVTPEEARAMPSKEWFGAKGRGLIARRAVAHYRAAHPEIALPGSRERGVPR